MEYRAGGEGEQKAMHEKSVAFLKQPGEMAR